MKKLNKNEKGFTVFEFAIVFAIVILIGAVGYIVYKNQHKPTLPIASYSSSDASKWLPFTSKADGFSAFFPTKPNYNETPTVTNPITLNVDGVNVVVKVTESNNGGAHSTYEVNYLTYPNTAKLPSLSRTPGYKNIHVIGSKKTTIDGRAAETYEFTANSVSQTINVSGRPFTIPSLDYSFYGEYVLDGKHVYDIYAINHPDNTIAYYAKYFVNNFKLSN